MLLTLLRTNTIRRDVLLPEIETQFQYGKNIALPFQKQRCILGLVKRNSEV